MAEDYPRNLREFEQRFSTEAACGDYLMTLRWPEGFRCPACGGSRVWKIGRGDLMECAGCHRQSSLTAGTVLEGTRRPLTVWFRAMWWVTTQKPGISALGLQHALGLGSYQTAWAWLHKLRRAMVRPGRERLTGRIEVDESYIGGFESESGGGMRGRGTRRKALIAVAAEERGSQIGRIRMHRIRDASRESLEQFLQSNIEPGAVIHTDAWRGYARIESLGYLHEVTPVGDHGRLAHIVMPRANRVVSLLKRWLLGTHQGAVSHEQLDYYLDEFTFRFNRRRSHSRGKLFYRLLQQAVTTQAVPYRRLIGGRN